MNNTKFSYAATTTERISFPLSVKVVMIDLDGTLLNTADDLALAANLMLRALSKPELSIATIQSFIGKGIQRLVERSLTGDIDGKPDAELLSKALPIYHRFYAENLCINTRPYPGVVDGILNFKKAGFKLACITNKSEIFTLPLLRATNLLDYFEIVLSGDSLSKKKPDPMPLLHICKHFSTQPQEALLIGDSLNDTIAARAAGCYVFCVPYGYNEGRDVHKLDCDAIVESIVDTSKLLIIKP
ncbi:MAG: phosphoglycolate phosphatase [Nitrosomonas sp.]|nr:phosphoglycolate phosphatase [Nitrosomonas sp.]MDP1951084.1 phosphoglycolate phosphatase [Nitrosomonas sp.]